MITQCVIVKTHCVIKSVFIFPINLRTDRLKIFLPDRQIGKSSKYEKIQCLPGGGCRLQTCRGLAAQWFDSTLRTLDGTLNCDKQLDLVMHFFSDVYLLLFSAVIL